jgi:ABC-2 type transport system ATP-binding protein
MENIIEIKNLRKYFGDTKALNRFNLSIQKGEVMGFVGPNGAGKSTTIRILLGLIKKTSGGVTVFGKDPFKYATVLHKQIAFVPGEVYLWPNLTGGETIDLLAKLHNENTKSKKYKKQKQKYTELFDLDLNKRNRAYSKGNKQKVALISALVVTSELLLLDEPTSGLDPLLNKVFEDVILDLKKQEKTILLSSHIMSEVEKLCDKVTIIKEGKDIVSAATLEEIDAKLKSNESLENAIIDLYKTNK